MSEPSPALDPAARVRTTSQRLATACLALLFALPVAVAWFWAFEEPAQLAFTNHLDGGVVNEPLAAWQRAAGAALTAIPVLLVMLGLREARRCFQWFASGRVFAADPMRSLRRFSGWIAASAAAGIVCSAATSVVLTLGHPPGSRQLAIGVGSDEIFTLFFAAIVWTMAAVLEQGRALADENASFV